MKFDFWDPQFFKNLLTHLQYVAILELTATNSVAALFKELKMPELNFANVFDLVITMIILAISYDLMAQVLEMAFKGKL